MTKIKAYIVLALTLTFAGSSFLVPFGGFDPGAFPVPQENPPVQPAGYAFAIWGAIYLWLIVMGVIGVWRHTNDPDWDVARSPLIVSLAVGSVWLPVASRSPEWATVLIWIMLISALVAAIKAPRSAYWTFSAPVALYAGWLTAASSVSIGLLGAGYGIGPDQVGWAIIAILIALVIAGATTPRVSAPLYYVIAVAWALIGVVVQNISGATEGDTSIVAALAAGGAVALAVRSALAARSGKAKAA